MFDRFVRFGALNTPHEVAVTDGKTHVTFLGLDADVNRAAAALREGGVQPGRLVGLSVGDSYLNLILGLACARLGAPLAVLLVKLTAGMAQLARVELLIADADTPEQAAPSGVGTILADTGWVKAMMARPAEPAAPVQIDPSTLASVSFSSGTTGLPKTVGHSWETMLRRTEVAIGPNQRILSMIGSPAALLATIAAAWWRKGCLLLGPSEIGQFAAALPALDPTILFCSPVQLRALLAALPPGSMPRPGLVLATAGSFASEALNAEARQRLASEVHVSYASSEAGLVTLALSSSLKGPRSVGFPLPFVSVEVVDAQDRPLPAGEQGRIRVHTQGMATGYRDDEALTRDRFRDGWFYPGDLGVLEADGSLSVLGREDEVMNFGGAKFLPETIEDRVRGLPGVKEAAAFALEDEHGELQPWLAIVRGENFDERTVGPAIHMPDLPAVRLVWMDALPRTALGKVPREQLRQAARPLQEKLAAGAA